MRTEVIPRHRRPTYYFLSEVNSAAFVHLGTSIDMTRIRSHRAKSESQSLGRISYVSYVIWAVGRALGKFPDANASFFDGTFRPKITYHDSVDAKFTVDRIINGSHVVISPVIQNVDQLSLAHIQERVHYYRDTATDAMPELSQYLRLRKLPIVLGRLAYKTVLKNRTLRQKVQGSFTVTSLGRCSIDAFYPQCSTSTCFALGRIHDAPAVADGVLVARPTMQLSFSFDHRILDGTLAGELLTRVKNLLEELPLQSTTARPEESFEPGEIRDCVCK